MNARKKFFVGLFSSVFVCVAILVCCGVLMQINFETSNNADIVKEKLTNNNLDPTAQADTNVTDSNGKHAPKTIDKAKVDSVAKTVPDFGSSAQNGNAQNNVVPEKSSKDAPLSARYLEIGNVAESVLTVVGSDEVDPNDDTQAWVYYKYTADKTPDPQNDGDDPEPEPKPVAYKTLYITGEGPYEKTDGFVVGAWNAQAGSTAPWSAQIPFIKNVEFEGKISPYSINSFFSSATGYGGIWEAGIESITNFKEYFCTENVVTANFTFSGLTKECLTKDDIDDFNAWMPNLKSAKCMFQYSNLPEEYYKDFFYACKTYHDPDYYDTSGWTPQLTSCSYMFANISGGYKFNDGTVMPSKSIDFNSLDLYIDLTNVRDAEGMFANNPYLAEGSYLNFSAFPPKSKCNLKGFYWKCSSVWDIYASSLAIGLKKGDNLSHMFCYCTSAEYIEIFGHEYGLGVSDFSSVIGKKVCLFDGCEALIDGLNESIVPAEPFVWQPEFKYSQYATYCNEDGSHFGLLFDQDLKPDLVSWEVLNFPSRADYGLNEPTSHVYQDVEIKATFSDETGNAKAIKYLKGSDPVPADGGPHVDMICYDMDDPDVPVPYEKFEKQGKFLVDLGVYWWGSVRTNGDYFELQVFTDALLGIEIASPPKKTEYVKEQNFEKTGLTAKAHFVNKEDQTIQASSLSVSPSKLTSDVPGETKVPVTITYSTTIDGKKFTSSAEYSVTVVPLRLTSLKASGMKQECLTADVKSAPLNADYSRMTVTATYNNGTTKVIESGAYTVTNAQFPKITKAWSGNATVTYAEEMEEGEQTVSVKCPLNVLTAPKALQIGVTGSGTSQNYNYYYFPVFDNNHIPAGVDFYTAPFGTNTYTKITHSGGGLVTMQDIWNKWAQTGTKYTKPKLRLFYVGKTDFLTLRANGYGNKKWDSTCKWNGSGSQNSSLALKSYWGEGRLTDSPTNYTQEHWIGLDLSTSKPGGDDSQQGMAYLYLFDAAKANEYTAYNDSQRVCGLRDLIKLTLVDDRPDNFWIFNYSNPGWIWTRTNYNYGTSKKPDYREVYYDPTIKGFNSKGQATEYGTYVYLYRRAETGGTIMFSRIFH